MKKYFALFLIIAFVIVMIGCAVGPALNNAASDGDINTVNSLLDKGADVNEWYFGTPLMWASSVGKTEAVKLLIGRGADVNMMSKDGWSALGYAAYHNYPDIINILIDKGADVDKAINGLMQRAAVYPEQAAKCGKGINNIRKIHYQVALHGLREFETVARQYRESQQKPSLPEEALKFKAQAEFALKQKRFADATDLYANALNISPWWPDGHFNRGLILGMGELSRYTEAIIEMKKYLMLVPNAPNARSAQDKIYQWEGMIK
jgi:tetratricopeptide (TPR) repeat protein